MTQADSEADSQADPQADSQASIQVPIEMQGLRLDKALASLMPEYTRSTIQQWIKQDLVKIDGHPANQKFKLTGSEKLEISIPRQQTLHSPAQELDLNIIHEDEQILVLNKSSDLVVHPGAGNHDQTLLNGLLFHCPNLGSLPRAGIVHRLDKNTTGLMVVAKTEQARQNLIEQLSTREMHRQYLALVNGIMISGETIDQPVGRHRNDRLRMAVTSAGKSAITHTRVLEKFRCHSLVQANLQTGRTHQIRVHLSHRGYPIVGDKVYGNRYRPPPSSSEELSQSLQNFQRQALHAQELSLIHPASGEQQSWSQPPPEDLEKLISLLRLDKASNPD